MIEQAIAWATVVAGATIMFLAGRRTTRRLAWALGVFNQILWASFAIMTRTWGLIVGCLLYGGVYIRNFCRNQ